MYLFGLFVQIFGHGGKYITFHARGGNHVTGRGTEPSSWAGQEQDVFSECPGLFYLSSGTIGGEEFGSPILKSII